MPYNLVTFIMGNPGNTKNQVMKNKTKMQCFYGGYLNTRNNMSYKLRIDFENNKVVGWKDL